MFDISEYRDDVKEPFLGLVVELNYPCDCAACRKGEQKLKEQGRELRNLKRLHIVIKPVEKYENLQHAWYNESKIKWSAMGAFVYTLNMKLKFRPKSKEPEKQIEELKKFMEKNVFLWIPVQPAEYMSNELNREIPKNLPKNVLEARDVWIPTEKLSDKEIKKLGVDIEQLYNEGLEEWNEKKNAEYESDYDNEVDISEIF